MSRECAEMQAGNQGINSSKAIKSCSLSAALSPKETTTTHRECLSSSGKSRGSPYPKLASSGIRKASSVKVSSDRTLTSLSASPKTLPRKHKEKSGNRKSHFNKGRSENHLRKISRASGRPIITHNCLSPLVLAVIKRSWSASQTAELSRSPNS